MATPHVTSINPNSPFEYHPPALTWHVQAIDNPCHDEKGHIPILEPVAGTHREPSLQQILNRVASQHLIGKQALMDFLHHKSLAHCKIKTLANYCTTIIPFLNGAQALGRSQLDHLKPVDLEAFVERLQDRGMKPATLRLRLMCIYRFLRYLVESDKLFSDRFVRTIRIKTPQTLPMAMPPNDVHRLLSVVSDIRNRAMIVVLLRTGMRIGELLTLKVYDVRLSEQKALIWEGEKNSVGRVVCLSADALLALSRWFDSRDPHKEYLFYRRRGHNMCYATARIMFRKYLNKAGLHSLRHTFATDLLNAGMRIECLQQLLGHSSLEMTLRYARLTDQTREKEFFTAMARIEGGSHHEPDPLDCQLPPSSQTPELLHTHG